MQLVEARALKNFTNTALGSITEGDKLKISKDRLTLWKKQGLVEPIESEAASPAPEAKEPEPPKSKPAKRPVVKKARKGKGKHKK